MRIGEEEVCGGQMEQRYCTDDCKPRDKCHFVDVRIALVDVFPSKSHIKVDALGSVKFETPMSNSGNSDLTHGVTSEQDW